MYASSDNRVKYIITSMLISLAVLGGVLYFFAMKTSSDSTDADQIKMVVIPIIIVGVFSTFATIGIIIKVYHKALTSMQMQGQGQPSMMQFTLNKDPKLLESVISDDARNKDAIITEIKKFRNIKDMKEIDKHTIDLTVTHLDKSEHKYRAQTKKEGKDKKLTSLTRYS